MTGELEKIFQVKNKIENLKPKKEQRDSFQEDFKTYLEKGNGQEAQKTDSKEIQEPTKMEDETVIIEEEIPYEKVVSLINEIVLMIENVQNFENINSEELISINEDIKTLFIKDFPVNNGLELKENTLNITDIKLKDENTLVNLLKTLTAGDAIETLDKENLSLLKELLGKVSIEGASLEKKPKIESGVKNLLELVEVKIIEKESKIKTPQTIENKPISSLEIINAAKLENQGNNDFTSKDGQTEDNSLLKEDKFLKEIIGEEVNLPKMDSFKSKLIHTEQIQEAVSVNKETIVKDVVRNIKYMETNLLKELTVKIYPKELGEMTITVIKEEGFMKASIKANSKDTLALLQQNLVDIKKELGQGEIKISEVNISLYNDDTTFHRDGNLEQNNFNDNREKNNNRLSSKNDGLESLDEIVEEDLKSSEISMLA